jgi:hypothetical protein
LTAEDNVTVEHREVLLVDVEGVKVMKYRGYSLNVNKRLYRNSSDTSCSLYYFTLMYTTILTMTGTGYTYKANHLHIWLQGRIHVDSD